eukprot:TRINITY_DN44214_c0_g1_i5.p1 TRINITY_DN44214_c0_g1~~TRINITY_DN44214_c0_g1_i5.p1  ORF type:complete len:234 (-),score=44.93 TRINITY_DN44214_c0_g1_i5:32-733(-)
MQATSTALELALFWFLGSDQDADMGSVSDADDGGGDDDLRFDSFGLGGGTPRHGAQPKEPENEDDMDIDGSGSQQYTTVSHTLIAVNKIEDESEALRGLQRSYPVQHLPKFQALSTIDLTFDIIGLRLQEDAADVVSSDAVVLRVNANEGYHTVITHRLTPLHVLEPLLPHHFGWMLGIVCFGEAYRYSFTAREDREPTVEDVKPGDDVSFLEDVLDPEEEHHDCDLFPAWAE